MQLRLGYAITTGYYRGFLVQCKVMDILQINVHLKVFFFFWIAVGCI